MGHSDFWMELSVALVSGVILGAWGGFAASMRQVRSRLSEMQAGLTQRMNEMEIKMESRIQDVAQTAADNTMEIGKVKEREAANKERLERINRTVDDLNKKQDRQMEILLQISRRQGGG